MIIKNNTIITLSNNLQYIVLSETIYKGIKYYLMMGIKNNEADSSNVAIFKEKIEGTDTYIVKIKDPTLMSTLTSLLKTM